MSDWLLDNYKAITIGILLGMFVASVVFAVSVPFLAPHQHIHVIERVIQ